LVTKRLLPFEMITVLTAEGRRPAEITFNTVRSSTQLGINVLTVDGVSTNAGLVSVYEGALQKVPAIERAQATITGTRGDTANFTLVVTFKPEAMKPAESIGQ
jgi:hypothetical protein